MPPSLLAGALSGIAKNVGTRIVNTLRGKSTEPVNTSVQAPVATVGSQQLGPEKPILASAPNVSTPTPTALPQQTGIQLDPRFAGMSAGAIQDALENERRQRARGRGVDVTPSIGDTVDSSALSPDNTVDSLTAANQKRMQDLFARFDESESEKQAQTRINELLDTRNSLESRKKKAVANLMKNTEGLTERGLERVVRAEEAAFDDQIADIDTQITGFRENVSAIQQSRQEALNNIRLIQDMTGEEQIGGIQTDPLTGEQTAYFRNPLTGEVTTRQLGTVSVAPEVKQIITDDATGAIFAIQTNPQTGQLEQVQIGSVTATPRSGGASGETAAALKSIEAQNKAAFEKEQLISKLQEYRNALEGKNALDIILDPTVSSIKGELQAAYKRVEALGALDAGVERLVNNILGLNLATKFDANKQRKAVDGLIQRTREKDIYTSIYSPTTDTTVSGSGDVIIDDLDFSL